MLLKCSCAYLKYSCCHLCRGNAEGKNPRLQQQQKIPPTSNLATPCPPAPSLARVDVSFRRLLLLETHKHNKRPLPTAGRLLLRLESLPLGQTSIRAFYGQVSYSKVSCTGVSGYVGRGGVEPQSDGTPAYVVQLHVPLLLLLAIGGWSVTCFFSSRTGVSIVGPSLKHRPVCISVHNSAGEPASVQAQPRRVLLARRARA